jgi:hypothetical protein
MNYIGQTNANIQINDWDRKVELTIYIIFIKLPYECFDY